MAVLPGRLLIADDQADVLTALRWVFRGEPFETVTVQSPDAVMAALHQCETDVLLMDLNYSRDTASGQEGFDLLQRLQTLDHPPAAVVMTAAGSADLAVEALRRGARDFILKPWENTRLLTIVRQQFDLRHAQRHIKQLQAEIDRLRGTPPPQIA
jgi:FixJ family two-component response regulator